VSLKIKILILFLLGGLSLYGQSFMYSYTDPCTRELKTLTYDMSTPVVVSYYGRVRAFTYNEIQTGVFDAWINDIFSQVQTSPCQGVLTSTTTTSTTNLTTNIINTVLNLNSITAITSIGGISNNLGGTVNLGTNSNNNEQNNNSNNSNSSNNNASSNSSSSNPGNGNNGGESGNGGSNNSNPPGGGNTGGNGGNSGGGSNGGSETGGTGSGGNSGGTVQNDTKEGTTPTKEEIKETKVEEQKSSSNNVSKSTSKAKTETQKPAILLTGDIVGLQKTEDGSQDARGTFSYTRVKGDGSASLGLSADYMLRAKISNITIMRSWIGIKDNGNKHINLISSGFSIMPGSISNTSMFIRINSLKRFTALYGAAASYGKLYQEELISGLAIAGFMYKGKIAKKIDGTIIMAGVYSPYTKYYTADWFKSRPIIVPFFNFNYKMTKTFGIGLTGGTTYMAGQNVLNYQVLCGAKLIL
jgi:hypothetical protein